MLATVSTAVSLLLGEAVIRFFGVAPEIKVIELGSESCIYQRSTNPILGFELKPNFRCAKPDLIQSYERTNSHGQRDGARSIHKAEGVRRILLLGDSVVEGYGLREDDTISRQLEIIDSTGKTEVLNFGVSAYCTRAEIELLETKGLQFDPDEVVLVFVENDFDNFNREAFPLGGTIQRPPLATTLFANSHLFRATSVKLDLFHLGAEADPVQWNQNAIGDNNVVEGIRRLRALADRGTFRATIAVWPRFLNHEIVDVHVMPGSDRVLVIESLAELYGIPCFRLSHYFRQHWNSTADVANPRLHYTSGDELHPSREGARVAALAIQRYLSKDAVQPMPNKVVGDAGRAIEVARQLGSATPNYARVHNQLGSKLVKSGDLQAAMHEFNRALEEDSQNAVAHNNLGVVYERMSNEEQAQKHFVRAVELQSDFAHAHFNLSRLLVRQGRVKAATLGLQRVLAIDPHHVGALNLFGAELGKRKRFAEAESYLERAVLLAPEHAEAHNNLGVVYAAQGQLAQAARQFQTALEADPAHPRARQNLRSVQTALDQLPSEDGQDPSDQAKPGP